MTDEKEQDRELRKAIHKMCRQCDCWSDHDKDCEDMACSLYPYRPKERKG